MKLPRDPASLQAMRYIQLFDEALKKRGVQVLVGIETEFVADYDGDLDREHIGKLIDRAFEDAPEDIRFRLKEKEKALIFEGPVNRFYGETAHRQYEFTTSPTLPLQAAHRVAGLRKFVAASEFKPQMDIPELYNISFDPLTRHRGIRVTSGMHINCSLNALHPEHYESLMNTAEHNDFCRELLLKHLKLLNGTDLTLLMDHPDSFDRLYSDSENHSTGRGIMKRPTRQKTNFRDKYVEYRMPNASSNPYLSTLLVMSAFYEMLKDMPERSEQEPPGTEDIIRHCAPRLADFEKRHPEAFPHLPLSSDEALERFEHHSNVIKAMRDVAVEAGIAPERIERDLIDFKTQILKGADLQTAAIGASR